MVPGMVILLHIQQQMAQGISLAAMMPTALTGTLLNRKMGNVDFHVAKWVGLGAVLGGVGGSMIAGVTDPCTLKVVFGSFMVIMSVLMALKKSQTRSEPAADDAVSS